MFAYILTNIIHVHQGRLTTGLKKLDCLPVVRRDNEEVSSIYKDYTSTFRKLDNKPDESAHLLVARKVQKGRGSMIIFMEALFIV